MICDPINKSSIFSVFTDGVVVVEKSEINGSGIHRQEEISRTFTVVIKHSYRIVPAINIRTGPIILFAFRIHPVPHWQCREVLSCSVVISVQSSDSIELLAVILVLLQACIESSIVECTAEGIVMRYLLDRSVFTCYSTVVAKMVLGEVMEDGAIVIFPVERAAPIHRFCQSYRIDVVLVGRM